MKNSIILSMQIAAATIIGSNNFVAPSTELKILSSFSIRAVNDTLKKSDTVVAFVPGEITAKIIKNAAPAFSADNKTVFFGQFPKDGSCVIMRAEKSGRKWADPAIADFSGKFRDLEPAFAPSGKYLIFASNRPVDGDTSLLDGYYNGSNYQKRGGNLWKVSIGKEREGVPEHLPAIINANSSVFSPAVLSDGSLYFMRADSGGKFHIYRAQWKTGGYKEPVKAAFSLSAFGDYDPAVAPDESFLIFSSARAPALKTADLFIVFKNPQGWSVPVDLRSVFGDSVFGIEARLSPDLETLYFSNSRTAAGLNNPDEQYIWSVNITQLLRAHGIKTYGHK